MITTRELIDGASSPSPKDGRWLPVLPLGPVLPQRIRDAWAVLTGRAQAIQDESGSTGSTSR